MSTTTSTISSWFDFQDLSGTFSIADVVIALLLSFLLTSLVGVVYQKTHRNVSYSQSFVQTLVLVGMVIAVIMLVVGSNIARAFALVGALSVIRFRNAVKETRDVGFIFLAMAIGMTCGTRFYVLAIGSTLVMSAVLFIMFRFNWYRPKASNSMIKVQIPAEADASAIESTLSKYCTDFEFSGAESTRGGTLTELTYNVSLRSLNKVPELVAALRDANYSQKVSVLTGADQVGF